MDSLGKLRILNVNALKILAAVFMAIDHIGLLFFPYTLWLRAIGRLSMPLFAFALSEGCRYTRNKTKHFLLLFGLALVCQIVYYFFDNGNLYMCILVTFSLSVLTIYAMQNFKRRLFDGSKLFAQIVSALLFVGSVALSYTFCFFFNVDYGFRGCMTPVFASLFDFHRIPAPTELQKLDRLPLRVVCMSIPLVSLAIAYLPNALPFFALGAIPLLFLYNGEKGKRKMKYFFYLFYPLHLVILQGISMLLA